jgi:glycolate oxidase iron-sulfur subunit
MQLQDSINHAGGGQRAVHILELLAEALPKE